MFDCTLGRSPPKAKTGVRVPMGAQRSNKTDQNSENLEEFLASMRFNQQGKIDEILINIRILNPIQVQYQAKALKVGFRAGYKLR